MKHALVKNGLIIEYHDFNGTPPKLHPDKGQWLQYIEEAHPENISETQVAESVISITLSGVRKYWSLRDKTPVELWEYHEYAKRITAPKQLIFTTTGIAIKAWFDLNGLPVILKGDYVHLYCNEILEEHSNILLEYQDQITIDNIPVN